MKIILNSKPVRLGAPRPKTWGELLSRILRDHVTGEQGITRVKIDGREESDILTCNQDRPLPAGIGDIELVTQDALAITREGFEKIKALLDQIYNEIIDLGKLSDQEPPEEIAGKCRDIMEGTRPIINFIHSVGMNFNLDFSSIEFHQGTSIKDKITRYLNQLHKGVRMQQPGSTHDLTLFLQGPFREELSGWEQICDIILDKLKSDEP